MKRQKPANGSAVCMKEDDIERAAFVFANNAHRRPGCRFRRCIVAYGGDKQGGDASGHGIADGAGGPPVEITCRKMPKQIDDTRRGQRLCENLRQKLLATRAQAFKALQMSHQPRHLADRSVVFSGCGRIWLWNWHTDRRCELLLTIPR